MSKMSIKLKTRETCLQFGSETRHSVPKISWGSFRGQHEKKWGSFGGGDHFGVFLRDRSPYQRVTASMKSINTV